MKTIKWSLSIGLVGCKIEDEFEIEDYATEEEINEAVWEAVGDRLEWNWEES